jgi:histone deacetylase HOS3
MEEKPPLRACDVAEEFFARELSKHESATGVGTIVILHDDCYGHRFSRPIEKANELDYIYERPERLLAITLGISVAYVRLGERHSSGQNAPHPSDMLPQRIPFKIHKSTRTVDLLSTVVTNVHGTEWMQELKTICNDAERKLAAGEIEMARVPHPPVSGDDTPLPPKDEFFETDLYLSPESLNAIEGSLGGVLDGVDAVFTASATGAGPRRAFVGIRPPGHHCSSNWPNGFCWINNVHIGIEHARTQYGLTHAAIIDFDLHHGDGSQSLAFDQNVKYHNLPPERAKQMTSIGYFSLHDINSFPCENGDYDKVSAASVCLKGSFNHWAWNVHLEPWKKPEEFWKIYNEKYLVLLEQVRQFLQHHTTRLLQDKKNTRTPKATIFISAGFDASEHEGPNMQRHGVSVPTEFYARFTRDIVRLAEEEGTGVEGRIVSVLEGGYSDRALTTGVLSHLSGLTDGQVFSNALSTGPVSEALQQPSGVSTLGATSAAQAIPLSYNVDWWHKTQLEELAKRAKPAPPVAPGRARRANRGYQSPTVSFKAKVKDPEKLENSLPSAIVLRAPSPPPPEVDWATGSHALNKLLIPINRETQSYKPAQLKKKSVLGNIAPVPAALSAALLDAPTRQSARTRKPPTSYAEIGSDSERSSIRASSRASRRQTLADFSAMTVDPVPAARRKPRRTSVAPSTTSATENTIASRSSSAMSRKQSVTPTLSTTAGGGQAEQTRESSTSTQGVRGVPSVPRVSVSDIAMKKSRESETALDIDQLTTGLKRITLKLPATEEEYNARRTQKTQEVEKSVKAARRAPVAATKATSAAAKARGRPPKVKPVSSSTTTPAVAPALPTMASSVPPLDPSQIEQAVAAPLMQPQPVQLQRTTSAFPALGTEGHGLNEQIQPQTGQLPRPSFMNQMAPAPPMQSSRREDTPPLPPPSLPQIANYGESGIMAPPPRRPSTATATSRRLASPAGRATGLPVFTPTSHIPFAYGSDPPEREIIRVRSLSASRTSPRSGQAEEEVWLARSRSNSGPHGQQ